MRCSNRVRRAPAGLFGIARNRRTGRGGARLPRASGRRNRAAARAAPRRLARYEAAARVRRRIEPMAESDRQRLLARALALPQAHKSDFFGGRTPPAGADPTLLKRIDDTAFRTKLVEAHLAEGLQSPKGPQRIASIVRIYPAFDAPVRQASNGRVKRGAAAATRDPQRGLPTIDEMENLIARIREVEREVVAALV